MVKVDPIHQSPSDAQAPSLPPLDTSSPLYAKLRESLPEDDSSLNPFPFDLSDYVRIAVDPYESVAGLDEEQLSALSSNIALCRDVITFFTSCGNRSGYGGHTGGAYDTVPEVVILDAFFRARPESFVPVFYDEAGHRVATQYLMAALDGYLSPEFLRFYRRGHSLLPGHPELGLTPGIRFSSGRLGHMWGTVNGIAMAHPDRRVVLLSSDGSQMEGNDAEAARLAVAQNLNVTLVVDDNNITICGKPSDYLPGYDVVATLKGHGVETTTADGENLKVLYAALRNAVVNDGPRAVVVKRPMAPGIKGVEGTNHGHDAVNPKDAIPHLEQRGHQEAADYLKLVTKAGDPYRYRGVGESVSMRKTVGRAVTDAIAAMSPEDRSSNVMVIDSDLCGSTGLNQVAVAHPDVYVQSGVMERGNFAAAAGFGMSPDKQGVFSTFAAFLEMLCSEITMARLNRSNVFSHFSHSGVDDMSDNTCHFGINVLFADNGLEDGYDTALYFPGDAVQARKVVEKTFPLTDDNKGLRFVFTTRSSTPLIKKEDGVTDFYDDEYEFVPGKDEIIREGTAGYVVSFGDALYRCLDAVTVLKEEHGIDVGLINKPTLSAVDKETMNKIAASPMCLVVECLGKRTGLGSRFGTWLMETEHFGKNGTLCKYGTIATYREGCGGLWEQAYHQGFDSVSVQNKVKEMLKK